MCSATRVRAALATRAPVVLLSQCGQTDCSAVMGEPQLLQNMRRSFAAEPEEQGRHNSSQSLAPLQDTRIGGKKFQLCQIAQTDERGARSKRATGVLESSYPMTFPGVHAPLGVHLPCHAA